jgi:hypothetical protein
LEDFMDKKIAGVLGAVAALTSLDAAQAATQPAPTPAESFRPVSYADLLTPIPDAVALLNADDAARAQRTAEGADGVQVAQYHHHHHHHHHRRVLIIRRHHHHHHHHYRRHHHHHHHHSQYMAIPRRDA